MFVRASVALACLVAAQITAFLLIGAVAEEMTQEQRANLHEILARMATEENDAARTEYERRFPPLPERTVRYPLPEPFETERARSLHWRENHTTMAADAFMATIAANLVDRCRLRLPAEYPAFAEVGQRITIDAGIAGGVEAFGDFLGQVPSGFSARTFEQLSEPLEAIVAGAAYATSLPCDDAAIQSMILDVIEFDRPLRTFVHGEVTTLRVSCMRNGGHEAKCTCVEAVLVEIDPEAAWRSFPKELWDPTSELSARVREHC